MLRLADGTLIVLVGPSAAGKSSWAVEHFTTEQVVSADRLRAVVGEGEHDLTASADAFAVLDAIVAARVGRRLTTVVDTLGLDPVRRAGYRALADRHRVPCVAVTFDTPAAECRRRNASRPHRVPAAVLTRQLADFARVREALPAEGFTDLLAAQPVRMVPPAIAAAARQLAGADRPRPRSAAESQAQSEAEVKAGAGNGSESDADPEPESGNGRTARVRRLRFGLQLSAFEGPGGPATLGVRLAEAGRAAEAAGFDSLWVMDHVRQIPQLGRPWWEMPESSTTLGYLAAATRTIELGCLVNCVTYRNVALLGKITATLDVLSGGRAWCGLGAGWYEAEHAGYGWPFPPAAERLDLLQDALELLPLLWGPGAKSYTGRRIQVPEAICYPRPLRPPPILVGGSGERRTLRLAAEYAAACNLTGEPDTVRHKVSVLREHCAELGRDPAEVEVTHLSTALVAADPDELDAEVARRRPARNVARWAAWTNPGTVDDHLVRVRALADAGVQHVIVSLPGVWDGPAIERYGRVISQLR